MGGRVHVAEYGGDLLPLQGVGRGDEGEGGHNDLARQAQGADGDLQGHGGVAHADDVLHAEIVGQARLELLHQRAVIGQPQPVEHALDAVHEGGPVADIGPADV